MLWSSRADATSVYCYNTGEEWEDVRTAEELLDIGATELCNGGGIRQGSRISDEQRKSVNAVVVSTLIFSRGRKR